MNVGFQPTRPADDKPSCFGQQWDPKASECAGGPDAGFTHPKNGTHVRPMCDFYQQCGAHVSAKRMVGSIGHNLVPASSLIRGGPGMQPIPLPPTKQPVPQQSPSTFQAYIEQQRMKLAVPVAQQMQPFQYAGPYPYYPQQPQQQMMQHAAMQYPAPTYQLQYMVPGYLSVPEMRMHGESIWGLLGREVVRAMGKALGHTVANFFDTHPFRVPPPPPYVGGEGGENK